MHVISVNVGKGTPIQWNGEEKITGIFKFPTNEPIQLGFTDVAGDVVADRKNHAGEHKACYLFSSAQYPYWRKKYPHLSWDWGMFGENLTIADMDDSKIRIGTVYSIGTALVQISQPRQPCYKLGIRFGTQAMIKQFIKHGYPGAYVRILKEGQVTTGDPAVPVSVPDNELTISAYYKLLYSRYKDPHLVQLAITNEALPAYKRERLEKSNKKRGQKMPPA